MIFSLAIVPAIALLIYIYRKDRKEKEPMRLLLLLFIMGNILVLPASIIETILDEFFIDLTTEGSVGYAIIEGFIVAGLTEELGKYIILKKFTWKSKEFNCMFDGIVYAVFVSMGFAALENVVYVMDGGISVAILRMFASLPGHASFAVYMGYFYSKAKYYHKYGNKRKSKSYRKLAVLVPVLLHGFYDACIMIEEDVAGGWVLTMAILEWLIFVIAMFVGTFKFVNKASANDEVI